MATTSELPQLSPHPEKPLLYFSPMILARRRRLLKETRAMIAQDGLEGFSVRKLCQKAGVAQRTLYNAFQNKDRLIAFAIREAFEEFQAYVSTSTDATSVSGLLTRTLAINRRNFRVRNYTKAVCAIYFAPTTPRDVWQTLQDMSLRGNRAWLDRHSNSINGWIDINHFADSMANVQYATINDWCLGRLPDEEYLPRLAENMLTLLAGALHGDVAKEVGLHLDEIRRTGDVSQFINAIADPPRRRRDPETVEDAPKPSGRRSSGA